MHSTKGKKPIMKEYGTKTIIVIKVDYGQGKQIDII